MSGVCSNTKTGRTSVIRTLAAVIASLAIYFAPITAQSDELISFDLVRGSAGSTVSRLPYQSTTSVRRGDRLELSSDGGYDFVLNVSKSRYSDLGNRVIHASTEAGGKALLVVGNDGELLGSVTEFGERYKISTTSNGQRQIFREGNLGLEKRMDGGGLTPKVNFPAPDILINLNEEEPSSSLEAESAEQSSEVIYPMYKTGTAEISVLMYYDDSMSNPLSTIDFITQVANDAYADSGAKIEIEIVGTKAIDVADGLSHMDVISAMDEEEPPFEEIKSDRSFFAADLVYVLRSTRSSEDENVCGLANYGVYKNWHWSGGFEGLVQWKPNNGYDSYCDDLTFAHEVGHSLGAAHNREELTEDGEVPFGAYSYSYGRTMPGIFRTVMGYTIDGNEPIEALFSSPDLICGGIYRCGNLSTDPDSADNVSTFHSTGHLVASNEGPFAYEAVSSYARRVGESECTTSDDEAGFWTGAVLRNQSAFAVELLSSHFKRVDGSYAVFEFDPGERVAESGSSTGAGWCRAESADPVFGTIYTEVFMRYRHPETGAIVETEAHEAASDYEGEYRTVRVASGQGGSVSGNTTKSVRVGSSQTFTFTPNSGYVIDSIQSNCSGQRSGTSFTVDVGQDNCFVEATFQAVAAEATLRLQMEAPKQGEAYSGIGTARGWAVAEEGIDYVEVYVDGAFFQRVPYGGLRGDVGGIFPEIESASESGYSFTYNYSLLSDGAHTMKTIAVTKSGRQLEKSAQFTVAKFHKSYIRPTDQVDLNSASCSVTDDEISVLDAYIDGRIYDMSMKWRTADQGFELYEIR